ncbi:hypothetical protein WJX72_009605 [[Myrmecia] bisecta]|uniref:RNA methyltransferase n=1 Tax=[Myrmecia] bisecta TaxID=41462 RepID=A0AAW1QSU8_9CHLO
MDMSAYVWDKRISLSEPDRFLKLCVGAEDVDLSRNWRMGPGGAWQLGCYMVPHGLESFVRGRYSPIWGLGISVTCWAGSRLDIVGYVEVADGKLTADSIPNLHKLQRARWASLHPGKDFDESTLVSEATVRQQLTTAANTLKTAPALTGTHKQLPSGRYAVGTYWVQDTTAHCTALPLRQLTKNQKKKRRQKLAKKGKRAESQTLYGEDSHQGFLSSAACAASESELSTAAIIAAGLHSSGPAETPVEPRVASNIARPVSSGNPEGSDCEDQLNSDGSRAGGHAAPDAAADLGHETGDAAPPAKRQRQVYLHGNYHRYYGYRLGSAFEEDPRLQVLDKRWFQGRRCLDIGCNEGVVTLSVVQRFGCFSMLGVDIDEALVKKACRRLQTVRSEAASRQEHLRRHYPASAEAETLQGLGAQPSPAAQRKAAATAVRALGCTWFQCEDFVAAEHSAQSVDTVLCLSVTKWVHLNRGDEGLRSLFQKVRDVLTPGGFFVLEPQPWRSYKQAMRKQGVSAAPHSQLDQLHFRPEAFMEYLVQELTFKLVRSPEVAESAPGFDRPMYVFKKVLQGSP